METSLHRDLKNIYAGSAAETEVRFGPYRIDAVRGDQLIEIQFASLSSIRDKIRDLCQTSKIRVVKPIVAERQIIRQETPDGPIISRRKSPKHGKTIDLFDELIYWTNVFPHPNLIIEVPLVRVDEYRLPPGDDRRRRRYKAKHRIKDVMLVDVLSKTTIRRTSDLLKLIDVKRLPTPFNTSDLAKQLGCPRGLAQRITYFLRNIGAIHQAGKIGNALMYQTRRAA